MTALTIHDTERLREVMREANALRDEWYRLFHAADLVGGDELARRSAAIGRASDAYVDACISVFLCLAANCPELLEE